MEPNRIVLIRDFQQADLLSLTSLTNELGYPTTIEQMTSRMETISRLNNCWTFVAVVKGCVAGYVGLIKNHFWEKDGHFLRIQALVVSKDYRKIGVGRELLLAVERLAKQTETEVIVLNCATRAERQSAHQFYPKIGFQASSIGYMKNIVRGKNSNR